MSTNGIDNLIPLATRTTEERRELARKAGVASGQARARKKTLSKMLETWSTKEASDEDRARLQALGLDADDLINKATILVPLIENAKAGDVKSIRLLYELMGEDEKRQAEIRKLQAENKLLKLEQEQMKASMGAKETEAQALARTVDAILKGATGGV